MARKQKLRREAAVIGKDTKLRPEAAEIGKIKRKYKYQLCEHWGKEFERYIYESFNQT